MNKLCNNCAYCAEDSCRLHYFCCDNLLVLQGAAKQVLLICFPLTLPKLDTCGRTPHSYPLISYTHNLWETVYGEHIFTYFTDEIVDQLMLMFSVCAYVRALVHMPACMHFSCDVPQALNHSEVYLTSLSAKLNTAENITLEVTTSGFFLNNLYS